MPGVIGLWAYNRKQAVKFRTAEGWVYLLGVVLFATPYYFTLKVPEKVFTWFIEPSNFIISQEELYIDSMRLVLAALISLIFGLFFAYIRNRFGKASILEPFHNRCFEWKVNLSL